MKTLLTAALVLTVVQTIAQSTNTTSQLDPLTFGVVLDDPGMKNVLVKKDITYLTNDKETLSLDLYTPPGLKANEKRPAIIFLNAIGERAGQRKVKSWGIYTSWPSLMAAQGYMGISMETDGNRIQESIQGLFTFLKENGSQYHIDANRLGVYAASANVTQSAIYLMKPEASRGIKAAVLYYGNPPTGPFRKDLPVLFVVSEGDVRPNAYTGLWNEVLKNNAPWTIKMGTGMPHAFDAYSDNEEARKIIKETISFWKNHLDPVPAPAWKYSEGRDVLASIQMDRPKALNLLKSMSEKYPQDIQVLSFYADVLRQAQKLEESEIVYKKILVVKPNHTEAMIRMAALLYTRNQPAEAEGYIAKAVASGLMTRNDYAQLGYTLLVADKNKEAAIYYEKALAMEQRSFDYYNLACAYAKINEKDKAFAALEKSLEQGYGSKQQIESDGDFDKIRSDERYKALMEKMK
ncbi:MAG TPA: hypothetical protein VM012_10955 [Flavitalea sp.]|nr:hypothetical protein [Flavitalea sp.]